MVLVSGCACWLCGESFPQCVGCAGAWVVGTGCSMGLAPLEKSGAPGCMGYRKNGP